MTGTGTIKIDNAALPSGLAITPATSTIGLGGSVDYTATASYATYGSFNVARQSMWSTVPASGAIGFSPDALPSLNEMLQHSGTTAGSFTVEAVYRNQTATTALTVNSTRTITGIAITSAGVGAPTTSPYNSAVGVPAGLPITFGVTISYSDGTTDSSLTGVTFASSTAGVLNLTANTATTVNSGTTSVTTNVTASVAGSCTGGTCTSVAYPIVVDTATLKATASFNPVNPTLPEHASEPLSITGSYTDGSSYDISALVSSSSANSAIVGVSTTATGTTISSFGTPTTSPITLSFIKDGQTFAYGVNVNAGVCYTGLTVTPVTVTSLPAGASQQFKATATDNSGNKVDVTSGAGAAAWGITSGTSLANKGSGLFLASTTVSGNNTITATLSGGNVCNGGDVTNTTLTSSATVTVTTATVTSLKVAFADGATFGQLPLGESRQLAVTGILSDGTTTDVTASCTFTAVAPPIVSTTATGLVSGAAAGSAGINVVYTPNGTNASPSITVSNCGNPAVTISGVAGNVAVGQTEDFTAQAKYTGGGACSASGNQLLFNTTATGTWASSNTALATISNTAPNNGQLTAVAVGTGANTTSNVTQTYKGVVSNTIAVRPSPLRCQPSWRLRALRWRTVRPRPLPSFRPGRTAVTTTSESVGQYLLRLRSPSGRRPARQVVAPRHSQVSQSPPLPFRSSQRRTACPRPPSR